MSEINSKSRMKRLAIQSGEMGEPMQAPRGSAYFVFTPAGSLIYETGSRTERAAEKKCMKLGAHMPYGTNWKAWDKRGYSVELLPMTP